MKNKKLGFTLIELLVVVLIIGILAAIAVPQYQKAVTKTRATQLQTLVSQVASTSREYYLTTGTNPTKFSDLNITLPLQKATTAECALAIDSADAVMKGEDFQITLNMDKAKSGHRFEIITGLFTKGDYKCTGFVYIIYNNKDLPTNQLICVESGTSNLRGAKKQRGDFCTKVMGLPFYGYEYEYDYFK